MYEKEIPDLEYENIMDQNEITFSQSDIRHNFDESLPTNFDVGVVDV